LPYKYTWEQWSFSQRKDICEIEEAHMKSKIIILVIILSLLPLFNLLAEENNLEGEITLDSMISNIAGNKAKFNEYRDIRDGLGVYGRIRLNYDTEKYLMNFKADDIGYDTQHYRLEGGLWGKFKAYLDYNEIPHNFTFGAKSFYDGIGTNNLTYPTHPPSTNISTWKEFDYAIERKKYGGGFKLEMLKPLFFDVSASREERDGIFPIGAAGTSPGGISLELPEPIDYTTDNVKVEAGYAKNPIFLSLSYFYSQFENGNRNLNFRNPATANTASTTDTSTLAPDNNYYKLAFKGAVKLPMRSKFSTNLNFSRTKSDVNLLSSYVADVAGGRTNITLSDPTFHGKIDTQNFDFVLSSNPISFLDGKVFYKHYKRDNKSDEITTTDGSSTFTNDLFDYKKDTYGAELGLKLPANLYLNSGYNYVKTKREREDIPENKDNLYSVDLRWRGLDFMVAKVGYERLHRNAEFEGSSDPNNIETYIRRFDAAAKDRDTYKASIDLSPMENLNFGIGYKLKNTDYKDVTLGLRDTKSNEFDIDGDYTIGQFIKLFGYLAYERIENNQFQRQLLPTDSGNPGTPPTATGFNWDVKQKDREYDYGIGAEIYVIPKKLTFTLQHDYVRSNGFADFTYLLGANPLPAGRTQDNIDISDWDDYRLRSYLVKAKYYATKNFTFSVGYAYEKFKYNDAQIEGYQFVPATTGSNGAYLTGAYRSPSYSASIVFVGATYKF
jgi:MtrB/PioB family decaheme-associated outer membrane protein